MPSTTITKPARHDTKNITEVKMRCCVEKHIYVEDQKLPGASCPGSQGLACQKHPDGDPRKGGGNDGPALHVVNFARRGVLVFGERCRRARQRRGIFAPKRGNKLRRNGRKDLVFTFLLYLLWFAFPLLTFLPFVAANSMNSLLRNVGD